MTSDQGGAGWRREPGRASGMALSTLEMRDHGAKVESMGLRTKEESGALRPEVELGDCHTNAELGIRRPKADSCCRTKPTE